jgi:hypothetical protein
MPSYDIVLKDLNSKIWDLIIKMLLSGNSEIKDSKTEPKSSYYFLFCKITVNRVFFIPLFGVFEVK